MRKAFNAVLAAFTSPDAVKAEKNLVVLVVTRLALAAGASTGIVELIKTLAK